MKWSYKCPLCGDGRETDWANHGIRMKCGACEKTRIVPSPADQHDAYVDQHDWPSEMERVVESIKGSVCTVPGCSKKGDTLDHRIPWSKNGPTSVNNLFPMCKEHNQSKSDTDYQTWLRTNP